MAGFEIEKIINQKSKHKRTNPMTRADLRVCEAIFARLQGKFRLIKVLTGRFALNIKKEDFLLFNASTSSLS